MIMLHRSNVFALLVALLVCSPWLAAPRPAFAATYTPPASNRVDLALDSGWKFNKGDVAGAEATGFNDSSWAAIDLPHTWNNLDGQDGGNDYYRGDGWYRTHYTVANTYAGRKFFLQFDGANRVTDVWINGNYLGQHQGGYAMFRFEATPYINVGGDNVIAVKVNNASNADVPPLSGDFTSFGGLYRNVHLLVTDKLQIKALDYGGPGVYLTPTNVSAASADLQITTKLWNDTGATRNVTVNTVIVDANNAIVKTVASTQTIGASAGADVVQNTMITNPRLWNGLQDPYLYTAYVEVKDGDVVKDLVSQPLGFRFFRVDANNGFFLNGQYLDLHGVNRHQDRLDKGWAIGPAEHQEDYNLISEMGATTIRLAHYQHDQFFYGLADKGGMVIWAEIPLIDSVRGTQAFTDNAKQQLIELIRQNYNHPSIFFWSIGNEQRKDDAGVNNLLSQLDDVVHQEDATRLSTYASCCVSDTGPVTNHTDTIAYNKYFGWYNGPSEDFAAWADNLHNSSPTRKIGVSEYGAGASIFQHANNPSKPTPNGSFHPEEYQSLFHEVHWKAMKTRPFLWGKFIWNMFDFASDKRDEGDMAGRNDKGMVTFDRKVKKDAFFWYKANWRTWAASDGKVVYITSRRYTDRTNATTDIKVYSNADSVEVKLNGASLGSKTSSDHIFLWPGVTLANGENVVEATGTKGGSTLRDSATWTLNGGGGGGGGSNTIVRVNVGSSSPYTDGSGRVYGADAFFSGGTPRTITNPIGNTTDDALYQSYRYGSFTYALPVANGTYDVYLKFIEPYWGSAGARVFSVNAEGTTKLSNFDIYSEAGQFTYIEKSFRVEVSDGVLNLGFTPSSDLAVVSAIAVLKR